MKKPLFITASCLMATLCFAHEFILLAAKYRLQKGDDLELHLVVADGFNIQMERPFQKALTKSFELLTKDGTVNLATAADGDWPIVHRTVDFEGGGLIHLERNYARISLPTRQFLNYLTEDHIEGIAPLVDKKKAEQKERYSRYIKTLVQSGTDFNDTLYKTETGQAFEIVLLQNPYRLKHGAVLRAKVLFEGKPFAHKTVTARNRTGSEGATVQTAETNAAGICAFTLNRKGEWFLHATHMVPCPDKADSDWESFWTSFSFAIN